MLFSDKRSSFKKLKVKQPTVFCLPGFHLDTVWKKTQAEYIEQSLSLIRQYLLACRADPYCGVYLSEVDALKPYLDLFPEEHAWVVTLIQQERCSTGGAYNQPNETTIGGEALIRNFLMGKLYHKTLGGMESPVYMGWDAFGHVPQLPQILEKCGMQGVVFTRSNYRDPSVPIPGIPNLFMWLAPNGSRVYAQRIDYMLKPDVTLHTISDEALKANQQTWSNLNTALIVDAGDMQLPRAESIGNARSLSTGTPVIQFSGAAATKFFSSVDTLVAAKRLVLDSVTRDMTQYNEGCELSRMDLKIANRLVENQLFDAEVWGTIASLHGSEYPRRVLDYAWRQVLFCQHHDAITGCGSDVVFADLLDIYREAIEAASKECCQSLTALASAIDTTSNRNQSRIIVFNSLPWRRDGIVQAWLDCEGLNLETLNLVDSLDRTIPFDVEQVQFKPDGAPSKALAVWLQKDMNATGYDQLGLAEKKEAEVPFICEGDTRTWIENEFFRVHIDPDRGGGITSLVDKETGKEFINQDHAQPANDLMLLTEGAGDEPAWRLLTTGEKESASEGSAEIKTIEGNVSTRLIINAPGPGPCQRIQEIRLYRELPYIDCMTILENYQGYQKQVLENDPQQIRDLYLLAFPLDLPGALPVLEDRFYAKAYRRSRRFMDFHSSFYKWDSKHAMNSCYRWVDASWTFLVRFVEKKEEKGSLAIGPSEAVIGQEKHRGLRERLMMHLARHGVTCTPRFAQDDPKSDMLFRQCSFSIGTSEENAYTKALLEQDAKAKAFYQRNLKEIGYVCMVVEDRLSKSRKNSLPVFIFAGKTDTLNEQAVDEMIQSTVAHRWDCTYSSCFLEKISSVDDYGFAILNRGTTLCSMEADGTLALALMHTAPYPEPQTPWMFDFAEQKTHIFQYRLLPHRGDWRHAEIPRRAMEYNHETAAIIEPPHQGTLPHKKSFFSIEPGNILLSALKPAGFPDVEYRRPPKDNQSIIARMYEAHGEESNLWLECWQNAKNVKAVRMDETSLSSKREVYREDQFIRTISHANEILTLNLGLKYEKRITGKSVEDTKNKGIARVLTRYWRLNHGSTPEGFNPLVISLRGQPKSNSISNEIKILQFELVIANNCVSETQEGEVRLITPSYWRVLPATVKYKLQGGGFQVIPFHLVLDSSERDGYIKAQTTIQGMMIEDLIHIGRPPEFDLSMTLTEDAFNVHLQNNFPYEISGMVSIISPVESWPYSLVSDYSLSAISSPRQPYSIKSGKLESLAFPIKELQNRFGIRGDHHWLIIKLTSHFAVRYYHVRLDGGKSEGLGRILHPPYDPLPNQ